MTRPTVAVGLTRAAIVDAALELMDTHGVDWLTMRRLADHLGVSAPTLYWHVRNRSELIDAAIDRALDGFTSNFDASVEWREQVRGFMHSLRHQLTAHPSVTDMMRNRYPPSVHRLTLRAVEIVEAAGSNPVQVAERTRLMIWQVVGFTTLENNVRLGTAYHRRSGPASGPTYSVAAPPGVDDESRSVERSPVGEHLAVLDLDALFHLNVEVFVGGLEALGDADPTRS